MLVKLLRVQSKFQLPQHVVFVVDGQQMHHYSDYTVVDLLPLIQVHQKFQIPCLSIILVTQASLQLPHNILEKSLGLLARQIGSYGKLTDKRFKLEIFGDKSTLIKYEYGQHIIQAVKQYNESVTAHRLLVRLGLFYSSQLELFEKAQSLREQNRCNMQELTVADYPNVDIFIRTSGEPKVSDMMLFELTGDHQAYVPQIPYDINKISSIRFYFLITSWQFFRHDMEQIMQSELQRQQLRQQMKKRQEEIKNRMLESNDELDQLRNQYDSDTDQSSTSCGFSRANFTQK